MVFLLYPSWANSTVCHFVEDYSGLLKLADILVHKVNGKLCSFEANSVNDNFKTCFPIRFMSTNTSQSKEPNIKAMCFLKVLINNIIVENWDVMNFYQDKFWFVYWAWPSNWIGYIIQLLQAVTGPGVLYTRGGKWNPRRSQSSKAILTMRNIS